MNRVREIREKQDPPMRIEMLAARAGVSYQTMRFIEKGADCHLSAAFRIAQILGTSVDHLFCGDTRAV